MSAESRRGRRPYYADLTPREDERIRRIREEAWSRLDPPGGYERSEPHITLHPGFSCCHRTAAQVGGLASFVTGRGVEVLGLSYYPGPHDARVVKLDLGADFSVLRQAIEARVRGSGGSVDVAPVPGHITLFKSDGEAELRAGERRLRSMEGEYGGWDVTIDGFRLEARQ